MDKLFQTGSIERQYLDDTMKSFCRATGLHIEVVDVEGNTSFIPGDLERCGFCELIRSQPNGKEHCRKSYHRASIEAAKWEEPYFFRCHAGLVIWTVPILNQGNLIGSIICGQVLMWKPDEYFWQEIKTLKMGGEGLFQLKNLVNRIEIVSPGRIQAAAEMLFDVVNYVLKRDFFILEQKEASRIQQERIRQELVVRKKESGSSKGYTSYLKQERKLLQYIRIGDRVRTNNALQSLLGSLYTKAAGDKKVIMTRIIELAALVSRAAVEGGGDAERTLEMLKNFNFELMNMENVQELFSKAYHIVETFLCDIFVLVEKKHLSLVNEARDYIAANFSEPIQVVDVSKHLFISSSHLSRLFRKQLDCTVNEYLTRVRIEMSVELMKKYELSVQQVAKAVGFQSQSYFTRVFKNYIGVTPLVYRNSLF